MGGFETRPYVATSLRRAPFAGRKRRWGCLFTPSGIVPLVISEVSECFRGEETYSFWLWHCEVACERQGDCIGFVGTLSTGGTDLVFGFELQLTSGVVLLGE